jgi:4-aminobenzoate N-oxygenase
MHLEITVTGSSLAALEEADMPVGSDTLKRLVAAWPRRATIRTDMAAYLEPAAYDLDLPDYPEQLIPFTAHPRYAEAPEERRRLLGTLAWQAFNARVIAAEELVANPTFEMLAHGVFPGTERYTVREAIQQSHIDEVWHTYMHMTAMNRTQAARGLTDEPDYSYPVTNRRLFRLAGQAAEKWERDLLFLLWTVVGEVSFNAFLELFAREKEVQPAHALVARLHARDEAAHGPVLAGVIKEVFVHLNKEQRALFTRTLPAAIEAFGAEDYELWPDLFAAAGIEHAEEIIADTRSAPGTELLLTDFATVHRLVRELGIEDEVDYDFTHVSPRAATA